MARCERAAHGTDRRRPSHPSGLWRGRCSRPEGFDVIGEAVDGASALTEAERLRPELVLLDAQLPDTDGFAVAAELTRERRRARRSSSPRAGTPPTSGRSSPRAVRSASWRRPSSRPRRSRRSCHDAAGVTRAALWVVGGGAGVGLRDRDRAQRHGEPRVHRVRADHRRVVHRHRARGARPPAREPVRAAALRGRGRPGSSGRCRRRGTPTSSSSPRSSRTVYYAVLVHAILAYPRGRLESRAAAVIVAAAYADTLGIQLVVSLVGVVARPHERPRRAAERAARLAPPRPRIGGVEPLGRGRRRAPRRGRRDRDPAVAVGLGGGAARARARPRDERRRPRDDRRRLCSSRSRPATPRGTVAFVVSSLAFASVPIGFLVGHPAHEPLAVGCARGADRRALAQPRAGPGAAGAAPGGRRPQPRAGLLARRPARLRGRGRAAARPGRAARPRRHHRRTVGQAGGGAHPRPGARPTTQSSSRRSAAPPAWRSRTSSFRPTCARASAPSSSPSAASASCSRTST